MQIYIRLNNNKSKKRRKDFLGIENNIKQGKFKQFMFYFNTNWVSYE